MPTETTPAVELSLAVEQVLGLARENIIAERDYPQDAAFQQACCDTVSDFFVNNVFK